MEYVEYLQRLFSLPYAPIWIPAVVFTVLFGGAYFMTRRSPGLEDATGPAPAEAASPASESEVVTGLPTQRKNQRASNRRQGNPVRILVAHPDYKHEAEPACLLDRSLGGMRLVVDYEIEVGTTVSIKPEKADTMVPWIDLDVRSCRQSTEMPGKWEVGCQYVKTPPYSILLLFG